MRDERGRDGQGDDGGEKGEGEDDRVEESDRSVGHHGESDARGGCGLKCESSEALQVGNR